MAFTPDEALSLLEKAEAGNRLAHAYLITGPDDSAVRELAVNLCGVIMGEKSGSLKHSDVHAIEPESKSRRIVIEQVRGLEKELQMRSMLGGRKVGIIFDADRLQEQAANAFLKTLEEPPRNSHLILVSTLPDQLLETILSRCIEIPLRQVESRELTARQKDLLKMLRDFCKAERPDLSQTFLFVRELQGILAGAKSDFADEGEAQFKGERQMYRDTTGASSSWMDDREDYFKARSEARYRRERSALLQVLEQWWGDVLRLQQGSANLDYPDFAADTLALAGRLTLPDVLHRTTAMGRLRENLEFNVQEQLAIEVAFLEAFAA